MWCGLVWENSPFVECSVVVARGPSAMIGHGDDMAWGLNPYRGPDWAPGWGPDCNTGWGPNLDLIGVLEMLSRSAWPVFGCTWMMGLDCF